MADSTEAVLQPMEIEDSRDQATSDDLPNENIAPNNSEELLNLEDKQPEDENDQEWEDAPKATDNLEDELDNEEMEMVTVAGSGKVPKWVVSQDEEIPFLGGFSAAIRRKYKTIFGNCSNMGFHNIFYVCQNNPLAIWDKGARCGVIKRTMDDDGFLALKIADHGKFKDGLMSTFITAPCAPFRSLGIYLPYMLVTVKNINQEFMFRVLVKDSLNTVRSLVFTTRVTMGKRYIYGVEVPLRLEMGWNHLEFDLNSYLFRAYRTYCREVVRVTIFPNCRLRMITFVNTPITVHHECAIMNEILKECLKNKMMDPTFSWKFDGCETQFVMAKVAIPDNLREYLSRASIKRQADALRLKEKERAPLYQPKAIITRPPLSPKRSSSLSHARRSSSSRNISVGWREAYARKSTELIRTQSRLEQSTKLRKVTEEAVKFSFADAEKRMAAQMQKKSKKQEKGKVFFGPPAPVPLLENNPDVVVVGSKNNRLTVVDLSEGADAKTKDLKAFQIGSQTYLVELGSNEASAASSVIRLLTQEAENNALRPLTVNSAHELRTKPTSASSDTALALEPEIQSPSDPLYEDMDGPDPIWTTFNSQNTVLVNSLKAWAPPVAQMDIPPTPPTTAERHSDTVLQDLRKETISAQAAHSFTENLLRDPVEVPQFELPIDVKTKLKDQLTIMLAKAKALDSQQAEALNQDETTTAEKRGLEDEALPGTSTPPGGPDKRLRWENDLVPAKSGTRPKVLAKRKQVAKRFSALSLRQKKNNELIGYAVRDRRFEQAWTVAPQMKKPPVPKHTIPPRRKSSVGVIKLGSGLMTDLREAVTAMRQNEESQENARRQFRKMKKLINQRRRRDSDNSSQAPAASSSAAATQRESESAITGESQRKP